MPEYVVQPLLQSVTIAASDVHCRGECRHRSDEECAAETHLVFPYRGLFMRHVGSSQSVADANHVLFFNTGEGYQVSHPASGGDACLSLSILQPLLQELAPAALLQRRDAPMFRGQSLRIDERAQVLVALLRHSLRSGAIEPLEAESLALTLVCRSLDPRTTHAAGSTRARQRLVDRAKLLLASDLTRRWTLAEIASEVGGSPIYLTQAFKQVEGMPLYRLPQASAAGACTGPDRRLRRRRRACAGTRLLQPQPFQRGVPPGLRPHAQRIPRSRAGQVGLNR